LHRHIGTITIDHLLNDERVRRIEVASRTHYAAADLAAMLNEGCEALPDWTILKRTFPALRSQCVQVVDPQTGEPLEVLPLAGVMRLVQAIDSPKASRLRAWMADVAAQHVEEEADPDLAVQRLRQGYHAKGRRRSWIDQRLRSISARHELVAEWYKRGVKESEQFRALTNRLMEATFGRNVNAYHQERGGAGSLRDNLSDLELSLLSLAETTAAAMHRRRQSTDVERLLRDIDDAGRIVNRARGEIDQASDRKSSSDQGNPHDPIAA
jgi:hypothetical protein